MKSIVIASPREPCGATWLINCLLELGVLTFRVSPSSMWRREGERMVLRPSEYILKKWLPSLSNHAAFSFRPNIEVEWTHSWPTAGSEGKRIVYFYRDPRDALYSRYKREAATLSFADYLDWLEPTTLLDKVESNALHTLCWMQHPNVRLFRFEDYKRDAVGTLREILRFIEVDATANDVARAVAASTAEKAREAEEQFNACTVSNAARGEIHQVVNQGGKIGRWQELSDQDMHSVRRIERLLGKTLLDFGYKTDPPGSPARPIAHYAAFLRTLDDFKNVTRTPDVSESTIEAVVELDARVARFASHLTVEALAASGMTESERNRLLCSLAMHLASRDEKALDQLRRLSAQVSNAPELYFQLFKRTRQLQWLPLIGARFMTQKLIRASRVQLSKTGWLNP